MAYDFKKEFKELYLPKTEPSIITVPPIKFIAVSGQGDPNIEDGKYKQAIGLLYSIAYTIKMSKMGDHQINDYFDFVVPPLEGFWQQDGIDGFDYAHKEGFIWTSAIRVPDFVTQAEFDWAIEDATNKKELDFSEVELIEIDEGECVQIMHIGPYDDEPATVALMDEFIAEKGYMNDFSDARRHHEIYISDPRRTSPDKLKTVIRHPIRRA